MVAEMVANIKHIHSGELAERLVIANPKDPEELLEKLRDQAEFHADDEPGDERARRLREKEEAFLASLGTQFKDNRR